MTRRKSWNGIRNAALVLACMALLCPVRAAVEIPADSWTDVSRQPDGSCLVRLARGAPDGEPPPIFVDRQRIELRCTALDGRRLDLDVLELTRGSGSRRVALRPSRDQLERGFIVRDAGTPIGRPQGALLDWEGDPWARHCFLRIEVREQGLYKLTREYLDEHAPGFYPDPRTWTLVHNGRTEPLHALGCDDGSFDPGDRVEFWAECTVPDEPELGPDTALDPWSSLEVYFLASDGSLGPRLAQETGEIVETDPALYHTPLTFPCRLHFEENTDFKRLYSVQDETAPEHEFWGAGVFAGELKPFAFEIPGVNAAATSPFDLTVCMRGLSAPPAYEEEETYHQRVQIYVNDYTDPALDIGADGSWKNQEMKIVELSGEAFLGHENLRADANTLYIAGLEIPPAGEFSAVLLNWFEIEYQRYYIAAGDELVFTAEPALDSWLLDFTASGFGGSDVQVYKIGRSLITNTIIRPAAGGFSVRFQDGFEAGRRYVALREGAKREPFRVEAVNWHGLDSPANSAAYLVIMADSLHRSGGAETVQPLADLWQSEIGDVTVVSDRWVYDEFSHGKFRPQALRRFVRTALETWTGAPSYVLLLGGAGRSQREALADGAPLLPVWFRQVYGWGGASTDEWLVTSEYGADYSALVARWPMDSQADLENMVAKALAYEDADGGAWRNRILMIAGARSQDAGIFQEQTEELVRTRIPATHFLRRLEVGETATLYSGGTEELIALFDQGQLLVNYSGHGGGAVWHDDNLFRSEDVPSLSNSRRLSFVTNATCHIASLESANSLGKALLNAGPMGAAGVLGSTGLGFQVTGTELVGYFYEYLLGNPGISVSQALRLAEQRIHVVHVAGQEEELEARIGRSAIELATVLGLPSLEPQVPQPDRRLGLTAPVVEAGGMLQLFGSAESASAQGWLEIHSTAAHPVLQDGDFVDGVQTHALEVGADSTWSLEIPAPETLFRGGRPASVRLLLDEPETGTASSGVTWFHYADSLEQAYLWGAGFLPEQPMAGDSIYITLLAAAPEPIDSLLADVSVGSPAWPETDYELELQPDPMDPQRFETTEGIGPFQQGDTLVTRFRVYYGGIEELSTDLYLLIEDPAPDALLGLRGYGERHGGKLALRLENAGELDLAPVELRLTGAAGDSLHSWTSPAVPAGESREFEFPVERGLLGDTLRMLVDPGGLVLEETEQPQFHFVQDPLFLHPATDADSGWREIDGLLSLRKPSEASASGVARVGRLEEQRFLSRQPDLQLISPVYSIAALDEGALPQPEGAYRETGHDSSSVNQVRLLGLDGETESLVSLEILPAQLSGDTLQVDFMLSAFVGFALGRLYDTEAPRVELSVNDQVFTEGGYVPRAPVFNFLLWDRNGIRSDSSAFRLELDGGEIPREDLSFNADPESGQLSVRYSPEFDGLPADSLHTLEILATDAAGNTTAATHRFLVADHFALLHIGNYPNPFRRQTRFAFSLTDTAERARVEIYTVSGRRIRTLYHQGTVIGYGEIFWDGRDHRSDLVANGVYYYRFVAERGGRELTRVGKMAKIK